MTGWLAKLCLHADGAAMSRYRTEFLAAASAFPEASARFRSLAKAAFGQIARRCVRFDPRPVGNPFREPDCTRWSGPPPR